MMLVLAAVAHADPVEVVVRDADGRALAASVVSAADIEGTTDRRGRVVLELEPGPHTLQILAPGYQPVDWAIEVPRPRPVRVDLSPSDAELEVVVEGLRTTPHASRHVVDAEKAMETPGTLEDAVRLVQSLPGVTVQREYSPTSGELSVRGSAPGDSRYFLDGIEIPYLYHFNQYASVFPTSQIGTLELLPSTFGASFGDAVGAVVDARSRLEVPTEVEGGGHVNFVMAGADVRAPLNQAAKPLWFSASGRRSYQDLAGEQTTQYPVWPVFHDYVVRVEQGDEREGTGAFVMSAGDSYHRAIAELDVVDPVEAEQSAVLTYAEGFQVVGAHHRFATEEVQGRVVAAAVHHHREGSLSDRGSEALDAWTGVLRADLGGRLHRLLGWDAGMEVRSSDTSLQVEPGGPDAFRVAEEVPALARSQAVDGQLVRQQVGVYGTAKVGYGTLVAMPGLRVEGDDTAGIQLGPRMVVRLRPVEGTAFKLAGGRYTQRPATEHLFAGAGSADLPTTVSWQGAAGWEQVAGRFEFGLDGYLKEERSPLFYPVDGPALAVDRGRAVGVEALTRYRLRERLFLWGWLAVQRTQVELAEGWVAADGDQRISGGVVGSLDVGHTNLGLRYRAASGLPFTQLEGSLYDAGTDRWVPVPGSENGARLPVYHKVDLRVAYTWRLPGWSLTASAEVWLVPRSSAQLYPTWNYDYTEQGWVSGPTVLPLLGLRARF